MTDTKTRKLRIPFAFYGSVVIDCTDEEWESSDATPLHDKAEKAFGEQIESFHDMDWDGFDMTSCQFEDEEE